MKPYSLIVTKIFLASLLLAFISLKAKAEGNAPISSVNDYDSLVNEVVSFINEQRSSNGNQFVFDKREGIAKKLCPIYVNSLNGKLEEFYNTPPQTVAYYTLFINTDFHALDEDAYNSVFSLKKDKIGFADIERLKENVKTIKEKFVTDVAEKSNLGKEGVYVVLSVYNFQFKVGEDQTPVWEVDPMVYFDKRLKQDVTDEFYREVFLHNNSALNGADCPEDQCLCNVVGDQISDILIALEKVKRVGKPDYLSLLREETNAEKAIYYILQLNSIDLTRLTSAERYRILALIATVDLDDVNGGETAAISLISSTPETKSEQSFLLDALKIDNLLVQLVKRIDGDNFVRFVNEITKIITSVNPPPGAEDYVKNLTDRHVIEFDGDFLGDVVEKYFNDKGEVKLWVRTPFTFNVRNDITVSPYKYINVKFKEHFTIGGKTYYPSEVGVMMPAIYVYLLFNEANNNKISVATKVVINAALFAVGVGELSAALEAKNAYSVALAVTDLGFSTSGLLIDVALADKLKDSEQGRKILHYYNMINLFYGVGRVSYSILSAAKGALMASEDMLKGNSLDDAERSVVEEIEESADEIIEAGGEVVESLVVENAMKRLDNLGLSALKNKINLLDEVTQGKFWDDFAGASDEALKTINNNTSLVDSWKTLKLAEVEDAIRLGKNGELEQVSKHLSDFNKAPEQLADEIKKAGSYQKWVEDLGKAVANPKSIIKFVDNYNIKHSGLIAEFYDQANNPIGRLYKNVQGDKLQYTFKQFKPDGNILKVEDQLIYLENGILYGDLNLEKVKGLGVGSTIFDDAVQFFGDRTIGVGGIWEVNPAYANGISDNLIAYRNALRANKSAEEAALSTSTGFWASKNQFKKVEFIGDNSINASVIKVIFKK